MSRLVTTRVVIFVLFVLAILFGYNYFFHPFSFRETSEVTEPSQNPTNQQEKEVDIKTLVSAMTPEEKVSQLLAMPVLLVDPATVKKSEAVEPEVAISDELGEDSFEESFEDFESGSKSESGSESGSEAENESLGTNISPELLLRAGTSSEDTNGAEPTVFKPGFVTIFGHDLPTDVTEMEINSLRDDLTLDVLVDGSSHEIKPAFAVDHEGGSVQRLTGEGFTVLPSWQELCQQEQDDRTGILRQSSLELKKVGINIVLAPMVDLATNNPVLKDRVCSGDPDIVSASALDYVALFDFEGIMPVIKHFPGIGQTTRDLHFGYQIINPKQEELNMFRYVLDNLPSIGIMTTFVGVSTQDANAPCALSKDCVGQLESEYPEALLFTDGLDMASSSGGGGFGAQMDLAEKSQLAIEAGNHVLIYGGGVTASQLQEVVEELAENYTQDQDFASQVDKQLLKVLEFKRVRGIL